MLHPKLPFSGKEDICIAECDYLVKKKGCTEIWNGGNRFIWKYYEMRRASGRYCAGKEYTGRR
ncbi:MAG: hypothetical protein HOC71_11920 [Candidatus Latescibacteria bacterium]|nr:hypothetical protein [Candidatus Latescibacterota bacterium]